MTIGLKPYPAYRDSGAPWLGQVPEHWNAKPNRALFEESKDSNHPDEPLLSVTISGGVIPQSDLLSDTSKKDSSNVDKSKYKLVLPGEIAYNKMRAWQGAIGLSRHRGIISPAYVVQRPRAGVSPEYMHYLLRTPGFAKEAERWSYGITSDMWSLRPEHFRMILACLPPAPEQSPIVRYLDYMDRRIGLYVRAKQKLIRLLEEQKQAVIHQAVTRGLDLTAPLKPSTVGGLGKVPQHWSVVRLKDVAVVQTGLTLGKDYRGLETEPYPYLRVANVQHGHVDLSEVKTLRAPEAEVARATLRPGDVLMTEGGDIDKLGRGCVWHGEIPGCLHQNHVFAVRCGQALAPEFLAGLMISGHGRAYFQRTAKQTTNLASTNSSILRAFPVLLPPRAEQEDILRAVGKRTVKLEAAISDAEGEISLLREYRTRLIADVVTGDLDVREAAAWLTEEPEAEEPRWVDEADEAPEEDDDGGEEAWGEEPSAE